VLGGIGGWTVRDIVPRLGLLESAVIAGTIITEAIAAHRTFTSAVLVGLMPVCGNLYHHAVELFLKAGLSRKYSMRDLANRHKFGHCLPKIWEAFKADFASPALRQF
jgi:hypothetical protein